MTKKPRRNNNINAKGRNKYDSRQYLQLTYSMLTSPQFRNLDGSDVRILLEICTRHNGFNNGRIGAGLKDLSDTLNMSKSTVKRGLAKLEEMMFIKCIKKGRFRGRIASEWLVTFLESEGYRPSNEWGSAKVKPYKRKPKIKPLEEEIME